MMKLRLLLLIPVIIPLLYSCRATKHVGEGEYLLDRISLSTDNRNLKNSELKSYIRQEPNHKTFGLIGLPLFFYNLSNDKDNGWKPLVATHRYASCHLRQPTDGKITKPNRKSPLQQGLHRCNSNRRHNQTQKTHQGKIRCQIGNSLSYRPNDIPYLQRLHQENRYLRLDQFSRSSGKIIRPKYPRTRTTTHYGATTECRLLRIQQGIYHLYRRYDDRK